MQKSHRRRRAEALVEPLVEDCRTFAPWNMSPEAIAPVALVLFRGKRRIDCKFFRSLNQVKSVKGTRGEISKVQKSCRPLVAFLFVYEETKQMTQMELEKSRPLGNPQPISINHFRGL